MEQMRATIPALIRQNSPMWSFENFLIEEKSPVYSVVQK